LFGSLEGREGLWRIGRKKIEKSYILFERNFVKIDK
jgi:hypothetical protein